LFRSSALPSHGIKLYMNIIETAFTDFTGSVVPWWHRTFTEAEQKQWAVMDRHWYTAWAGESCSGRTVAGGRYFCDQALDEIEAIVRKCARQWAEDFAKDFPGLKAVTEFSVGTFNDGLAACTDPALATMFLDSQVNAFVDHGIEPFFWTWRMPYGPIFEPGWSLRHIMGKEVSKPSAPCRAIPREGQ